MLIDVKAKFWSKNNIKMILELTALLVFNLIFINPFGVAATVVLIHRVRIYRTSYKLLNKAISQNNKEKIVKYQKLLKDSYNDLLVIETKLNVEFVFVEEKQEEKEVFFNRIETPIFVSRERAVLAIFQE